MFIYNCKINGKLFLKILIILLFIIAISILIYVLSKFITTTKNSSQNSDMNNINSTFVTDDTIPREDINSIKSTNYTNILKATHDNIDNYVGMKINFTGYVYRVYGFADNQFVLARNMIISSDLQYVVVGFLCDYQNISEYANNSWVNITGTITKGSYNNKDIPIIKIDEITKVDEPKDSLVYPPDNYYIPTISMF